MLNANKIISNNTNGIINIEINICTIELCTIINKYDVIKFHSG